MKAKLRLANCNPRQVLQGKDNERYYLYRRPRFKIRVASPDAITAKAATNQPSRGPVGPSSVPNHEQSEEVDTKEID